MMEPFGKQFISSSKRLDTELPHDTATPLLEKRKHTSPQTLVHEAFIVALFAICKHSQFYGNLIFLNFTLILLHVNQYKNV